MLSENKHTKDTLVFYRIAPLSMTYYFKNPADSNKLGKIVETGLLQNSKFANDTLEKFLIKLGLCNNDMSEMVYIPCRGTHHILKINDNCSNLDSIIVIKNYPSDEYAYVYNGDDYSFTVIFTKNSNTDIYDLTQPLLYALVGYYIDDFGNKSIVLHGNVFYFTEDGLHWKERLENALVLYKWRNAKYVPDSLLTVDGNLIPKENYAETYERYIGKATH